MKIKVEIDMTAEYDRDLIEHIAECIPHQLTLFDNVRGALVDAISRGWHLHRDTISFSLGIPEKTDHTILILDDLTPEEFRRYETARDEYDRVAREEYEAEAAAKGESKLPEQLYGKVKSA